MAVKLYVVSRSDIPPGVRAAQFVHARWQFSQDQPAADKVWNDLGGSLVLLEVADAPALNALMESILKSGAPVAAWKDHYNGGEVQLTALAVFRHSRIDCLDDLPLAFRAGLTDSPGSGTSRPVPVVAQEPTAARHQRLAAVAAYDRLAEVYDRSYTGGKDRAEDRWVAGELCERRLLDGKVIDVGCGTGWLLNAIPALGVASYLGVDPSPRMRARARAKFPAHSFLDGLAEDLSIVAYESVDSLVSLFGSFSYSLEPEAAASEFARVLKPGGRVFVMAYGPPYARRQSYILNRYHVNVPKRFYSSSQLRTLFADAGFKDLEVIGFGRAIDALPASAPSWLFDAAVHIETGLGRSYPDLFCWQVLVGRV